MRSPHALRGLVSLFGSAVLSVAFAGEPGIAQHPLADSPVTAAVKARLAAGHLDELCPNLKVEADDQGTVWLTGSAGTEELAERVVESARNANGVNWVRSSIVVDGAVQH